jgi:putative ABC transport system permease protein
MEFSLHRVFFTHTVKIAVSMFQNYLKTALRSLKKNKGFTLINIFGLTLGLSICLLIVFYVVDELSYDRFNTKADRIFRVNSNIKFGESTLSFAQAGAPMAATLVREFPEVEKAVRLSIIHGTHFKKGDVRVLENGGVYSDPGIFDVFTLPMIEGDPATALATPNSIVLTESMAKKYFNDTHVIGRTLTLDDSRIRAVTGVIKDIPRQSHFNFDFFLSMTSLPDARSIYFNAINTNTYLLLRPGADHKKLASKFPALLRKVLAAQPGGWDMDAFEKSGNYFRMDLTPLTDIHLRSDRARELGANSDIQYIYIFSAIALFILLVACINFINLSTARSANRAREVGVRKVLGSSRRWLIAQFLSESMIVTLVATILAILTAWLLLPVFNRLSGKELVVTVHTIRWLLPALLGIILFVGLLAGSYPAFFLSSFQPIEVLKGRLTAGFKGAGIRGFLVVFQFSVSIFLIIGTQVIYHQLHFIQKKDLGFNRNQVLIVKNVESIPNPQLLKQEVKQLPGVTNATLSSFLPTGKKRWPNFVSTATTDVNVDFWPVDEDYIATLGMTLVRGRSFSRQFTTDSTAMVINEAAAAMMGFAADPLNKKIYIGVHRKEYTVIGVVKDFNFSSLRDHITPLVMMLDRPDQNALSIRVNTANLPALMARVEDKWNKLSGRQQFEYSFMDQDFDALYRAEQRMGQLCVVFTSLAILIACLGLFGLSIYAAEQRNREIAIRKVLGAEVPGLVAMLSRDFLKWVVLSILIATPLAWFFLQKWLQSFAYRDTIQWSVVVTAALGALLIAFLTVGYQSIKAALSNPIESLRAE